MKVDIEELGACKRRLQVEEAPEVVTKAWEQAFDRVQREARLPGFRKGKVPNENQFGHNILIVEDAVGFICAYQVMRDGSQDR